MTVTGAFTKATGGQMRLEDAISFRPQVDSTWTGGDICVITAAVLRIEATFTIGTGAGNFVCNSGNGEIQIVAGGRLQKSPAAPPRSRPGPSTPARSRWGRARRSTSPAA